MKSRKILSENLEIKALLDENRDIIDALRRLNEKISSEIAYQKPNIEHEKSVSASENDNIKLRNINHEEVRASRILKVDSE